MCDVAEGGRLPLSVAYNAIRSVEGVGKSIEKA